MTMFVLLLFFFFFFFFFFCYLFVVVVVVYRGRGGCHRWRWCGSRWRVRCSVSFVWTGVSVNSWVVSSFSGEVVSPRHFGWEANRQHCSPFLIYLLWMELSCKYMNGEILLCLYLTTLMTPYISRHKVKQFASIRSQLWQDCSGIVTVLCWWTVDMVDIRWLTIQTHTMLRVFCMQCMDSNFVCIKDIHCNLHPIQSVKRYHHLCCGFGSFWTLCWNSQRTEIK